MPRRRISTGKLHQLTPGDVGGALARERRGHSRGDHRRGGHSFVFPAAIQNPDRLDAADAQWHHRPSDDGADAELPRRAVEFVVLGRNYIDVVSKEDDRVEQIVPQKFGFFFTFSRIICRKQSFLVYASPDTLRQDFRVMLGNTYRRGEVIARGAIDTGDQVFVDKFSYNFVKPKRGDVFVFKTDNVALITADPETGAPYYIKRLTGLPATSFGSTRLCSM
jgi:hypothetical protein